MSQLRRAYFAEAGDIALRYGVALDRLDRHVCEARVLEPSMTVLPIRHVEDLIQAVACVDGADLAWWDLVEHHERALIRACRERLEAADAIIFVRRSYAELRRRSQTAFDRRFPSLRSFVGTCSLRRWLHERIPGGLHRSAGPGGGGPRLRLRGTGRTRTPECPPWSALVEVRDPQAAGSERGPRFAGG
jgi:hypothetical protein